MIPLLAVIHMKLKCFSLPLYQSVWLLSGVCVCVGVCILKDGVTLWSCYGKHILFFWLHSKCESSIQFPFRHVLVSAGSGEKFFTVFFWCSHSVTTAFTSEWRTLSAVWLLQVDFWLNTAGNKADETNLTEKFEGITTQVPWRPYLYIFLPYMNMLTTAHISTEHITAEYEHTWSTHHHVHICS